MGEEKITKGENERKNMEQISGVDGKKNEKENMKENGKEISNLWSTLLLCHDDYYMHSASAVNGADLVRSEDTHMFRHVWAEKRKTELS